MIRLLISLERLLRHVLNSKIAIPLIFKFLTITIICVTSISVAQIGENVMYLLFIYPWDLIFSVLIIALNYKEKTIEYNYPLLKY